MSSEKDSLVQRVESSYRQLSTVASDLNSVSDELGKSVGELDSALKKLNLGISVWVPITGGSSGENESYWGDDLGYSKLAGKWGIAIRTFSGTNYDPDRDEVESWLFNDAPRALRLSAIGKIPDLLEKLSGEATETTKKIRGQLAQAQEVAAVVKRASELHGSGKAVSAKLTIEKDSMAGVPPIVKKLIQSRTAAAQYTIHVNPAEPKTPLQAKVDSLSEFLNAGSKEPKK